MINIAQDNALTPVELDKLFTQEEQKALEARGFLGTPKPTLEEWVAHAQSEPKPEPTPAPTPDPMTTLMANLEAFIDKLVEEKVAAIMSSHATIALISQEQRDIMQSLIDDHESEHDHDEFCTKEHAEEILGDVDMESAVKRAISHSNIVEDIVDTRIDDINWEEKVREGLNDILG